MICKHFLKIWFRAINQEETWMAEQEMHSWSLDVMKCVKKEGETFPAENLEIWLGA